MSAGAPGGRPAPGPVYCRATPRQTRLAAAAAPGCRTPRAASVLAAARAAAAGRDERGGLARASRIIGGVVLPAKREGGPDDPPLPLAPGAGAGPSVGLSRLYRAEVSVPTDYAEEFVRYLAGRSRGLA